MVKELGPTVVLIHTLPNEASAVATNVGVAPPPHGAKVEAVFLGLTVPVAKSAELPSVSVQPLSALYTLTVALGAAVGPAPSKQFEAPKPTKSMTVAEGIGQGTVIAINV